MTLLDWTILIIWAGFTLSGFWKGAVRIVFGIGGLIVGVWMALALGETVEIWLLDIINIDWLAAVFGRIIPCVCCVMIFLISGWGLDRTLQALHLKFLNRALGALLAGCIGALLLGIFLITAIEMSADFAAISKNSILAPLLIEGWHAVVG